jgi:hypothetical protein
MIEADNGESFGASLLAVIFDRLARSKTSPLSLRLVPICRAAHGGTGSDFDRRLITASTKVRFGVKTGNPQSEHNLSAVRRKRTQGDSQAREPSD